ncbi:hypothetical protein G4B88_012759 [Cannabis sativa]|uniref:Endonuclease/exonuclease/phosphatase domain-containing protein n=1 Tax=Cannabis sativa TaxID=3483 RepID=A0A7J6GA46_CANSA|nr:hypothetical protein G4B88_012759 [Cannabis sativa]
MRLCEVLQFGENLWAVDRIGLSGGLLLMWKDDVKVRVDSSSPGHIVAEVAGRGFLPWTLTCFYGNPDAAQRKFSWELLRKICRETHGSWLCVGDFNEIDGTQSGKAKRNTRFHFEEAWCEEDECKAIVEGHWKSGEPCAIAGSFHGKTHRVGKILHGWNKKRKKELNGRITKAKKDVVDKGTRWRVGNGQRVRIVEDPWLPGPRSFKIYDKPELPAQLCVVDLTLPNGEWDESFIRANFNDEDAKLIISLPHVKDGVEDKMMWD